ncbi:short coiled-coil protein [Mytilus galloprovincialis]|uniref:Short coiled-coil protein n=1 Tax=Mytilus galloprovincialis TaxID=29158 RepID=A0A8B6CW90_MYTGA|nr:short coiled-coil protein [Mytilus galloprovincialis]
MSGEGMKEDLYSVPLSSDSDTGDIQQTNGYNTKRVPSGDNFTSLDPDINPDEEEEKQRLIAQVLELQNTLDDLSSRVDSVKEENLKLKSENQVLGQYIENLMAASSVFQSTEPKAKKKYVPELSVILR